MRVDLQVKIEPVNSIELPDSEVGKIGSHEVGKEKHILIDVNSANLDYETDGTVFYIELSKVFMKN